MKISSGTLTLPAPSRAAGDKLFYQSWIPDHPRAVALIAHGYAEHLGRYDLVAERLAHEGMAVFALDHWGHGRSDGTRGFVPRFSVFTDGLALLLATVKTTFPGLPRILIGHSMGGLIAVAHLLQAQGDYAGAALSGPALKTAEPPTVATRIIGNLLSRVMPQAGILQLDSAAISRDPAVVAAYLADPLVHTGKMSARMAVEMLATMAMVQSHAAEIALPLLIMHGSEDRLASPVGAREFFENASSLDKEFHDFLGLFHEIFNEPEREDVIKLLCSWVSKHLPENPDGNR